MQRILVQLAALIFFAMMLLAPSCMANDKEALPDKTIDDIIQEAKAELGSASIFYWLGMEEQGNCQAFRSGLDYLVRAERLLGEPGFPEHVKMSLQDEVDALRQELEDQLELASQNFYGKFPLVRLLRRSLFVDDAATQTFELLDDPGEVAVQRAVNDLRETIIAQWKNSTPIAVLVARTSESPPLQASLLEDLVAFELNKSAHFHLFPDHALVRMLSKEELELICDAPPSDELRLKLCEALNASHFLIVGITSQGEKNRHSICCYLIQGSAYDRHSSEPIRTVAVLGLCRDCRGVRLPILLVHIGLLLGAYLVYALLVFVRNGHWPGHYRLFSVPLVAFLFGRVTPWVFIPIMASFAPEPDAIITSSFWWPCLLGIAVVLGPLVACWIAADYVVGLKGLFSITDYGGAFSTAVGMGVCAYASTSIFLLQQNDAWLVLVPTVLAMGAISYLFGRTMDQGDPTDIWWLLLLLALSCWFGTALCMAAPIGLWTCVLAASVGIACALCMPFRRGKLEMAVRQPEGDVPGSTEELARLATDPPYVPFESFVEAREQIAPVLEGATCWLNLVGPRGCGKTATAEALMRSLRDEWQGGGLCVLEGACDEHGGSPYGPFREAFAGRDLFAPFDDRFRLIHNALQSVLGEAPGVVKPLIQVDKIGPRSEGSQSQFYASIAQGIRKRTQKGIVVLFIDNLQWIDESSCELLGYLLQEFQRKESRKHKRAPLLILTASRLEGRFHGLDVSANSLHVKTPSAGQQQTILTSKLGLCETSARRLVEYMGRETGDSGRLFWLLGNVANLARRNQLDRTGEGFELKREHMSGGKIPLAKDMRAELARRLPDSMHYRLILECAACIGEDFSGDLVARSLGKDRLDLLQALEAIERETGIVMDERDNDDAYRFTPPPMLEVVREELGITFEGPKATNVRQMVREHHARLGGVLEQQTSDHGSGSLFDVAKHYYAAGPSYAEKGLGFCRRAARAACAVFSYDLARRYLDMARECADCLQREAELDEEELLITCDEAHVTGRATVDAAKKTLDYVDQHPAASFSVLRACARACYDAALDTGNQELLAESCRLGQEMIESVNFNTGRAEGLHFIGISLPTTEKERRKEALWDAWELTESAAADDCDAQRLRGEVVNSLGEELSYGTRSDKEEAEELFTESLRIKRSLDDLPGMARSYGGLGRLALLADQPNTKLARDYFEKDLDISTQVRDSSGQAIMHSLLGDCDNIDGRFDEAIVHYKKSWDLAPQLKDKFFAGASLIEYYCRFDDAEAANRIGSELLSLLGDGAIPTNCALRLFSVLDDNESQLAAAWAEELKDRATASVESE